MSEKIYRVQMNSKGMPNFSTAEEVVMCKDCKHNPKYTDEYMYGKCIFCCEDDFYSGTPDDDWFCADGERKGE